MTSTKSEEKSSSTSRSEHENDDEDEDRMNFGNNFEFVLTSLGLAVGLGNIWRFPTRAYANGGSAFLIPYLICAMFFGLPAVYLEFIAGQYQRVSPPIVFRRIMPLVEGIGWAAGMVAALTAIYYIVLISWITIYLINAFRHMNVWTSCNNPWNDPKTCLVLLDQQKCSNSEYWPNEIITSSSSLFINGTCYDAHQFKNIKFIGGTEQYFKKYIVQPSDGGLFDIGNINWTMLSGMTFCWILTAFLILNGPKIMGRISYITVLSPYILVSALAIRGLFLEGSTTGLYYYFGKPDYSKIMTVKTWTEALKQLCFSLSVGHGGLMSLASYSKKRHNCFRDALIVIIGDTIMSVIGGAAVFTVLGFLAFKRGVEVPDVVESGLSLAFVVYPEAISQIPWSNFFMILFFLMLFLLAISSEMALVEVICSCIYDQNPKLKSRKWLVVSTWCFTLYIAGLIFSTNAGLYWFELYDEYAAGFGSVCVCTLEIITIVWIYGGKHFSNDIKIVIGEANSKFTAAIGPHSPYFIFNWRFISPLIGIVLIFLSTLREYPYLNDPIKYPIFFDIIGWSLSFLPLVMIPVFIYVNIYRFSKNGYHLGGLRRLQKQHLSFKRIYKTFDRNEKNFAKFLPTEEPWTTESKRDKNDSESENSSIDNGLSTNLQFDQYTLKKNEAISAAADEYQL